jgi:hypothetical protein
MRTVREFIAAMRAQFGHNSLWLIYRSTSPNLAEAPAEVMHSHFRPPGRGPKAPGQSPPSPRRALLALQVGRCPVLDGLNQFH